jgi:ribA/ribD-fused uncharacterized protein
MTEPYFIWTVQLYRTKGLDDQGIHVLDTTAKSGIKAFAPSFSDVMAYKDGKLSKEDYTKIYLQRMVDSRQNNPTDWKKLLAHKKVAVACYCSPGRFCHRHLFIKDHQTYLEALGHEVKLMGEINGAQYSDIMPQSIVSIPVERKIVPFYSKYDLLSNHSPHGFTVKSITFKHVEQFMMYCKAMLFGDKDQAAKILAEDNPQGCKVLGRGVKGFDEKIWIAKRRRYVLIACLQKAREHSEVREYVLSTGNAILVEASKSDVIWGVGIAKDDPRIYDISQWRGLNLLGEIWMEVRRILQEEIVF